MTIIPSLLALVLGVAATGMVGGSWVNYGEVTPATMLYLAQDMITPPPIEPVRIVEPAPALAPSTGTVAPAEPSVLIAPVQPVGTEGGSGGGTSAVPPSERPIMPSSPDQPGARDFSGQQSPQIQPMPPQDGQRDDGRGQPMPPSPGRNDQQNGRQSRPERSMPPQRGGNGQGNEMMPPEGDDFNDEEQQEPQIDPREIRQTLRDITQMQRQLKGFLRTLKRYKADTGEVDQLLEKMNQYRTTISGSDMEAVREAVHEFRDENLWETINVIRVKVELPKQIAQMKKELSRLEKTIRAAVYQKMGVDVSSITAYISDSRARISQMESLLNSGDFDEINSLMQENQENPMPGELMEVLSRLKQIDSRMKRVRDAGTKAKIQEMLSEVVQLVNEGEYREARDLMNQNMQQIMQIINPPRNNGNNRNTKNRMAPGTR